MDFFYLFNVSQKNLTNNINKRKNTTKETNWKHPNQKFDRKKLEKKS